VALQDKTVVVVGGGIAGTSAALGLAEVGAQVVVIERDDFVGGHAARLACKATDDCQRCNGCLVRPRLSALLNHPRVSILRRAEVTGMERDQAGLRLTATQRPAYIDTEACTGCGICIEACPAAGEGAFKRPGFAGDPVRLAIDPAHCLYFEDQRSTLCRDLCPEEAIGFDGSEQHHELAADAVVLATGFMPYEAARTPRYGYGQLPGVVTAMDLEAGLRAGDNPLAAVPEDRRPKVAFIQCVGSRRRQEGNNYCSRVCCGYALRLGRMLAHKYRAEVSVFYMDLQSFGHDFDRFLDAARQELRLVRAIPSDLDRGRQLAVRASYIDDSQGIAVAEEFDLVALSVGMAPRPTNPVIAELAGLALTAHGFLEPGPKTGAGVFTAGAAGGPMNVAESVAQGERAAGAVARYLEETL